MRSTFKLLYFVKRNAVKKNGNAPIIARITTDQVDIPARRATTPTAGAGVNLYLVERQAMLLRQGIQARGQH